MKTQYIPKGEMVHILAALMPANRLACEVSLATGLRIGDVLAIKTQQIMKIATRRVTVKEEKTGKGRTVYLPGDLLDKLRSQAGRFFVFENRLSPRKHRSRQAVHKDLKRAAALFRVRENIAPHSLRKVYAVEEFHRTGSLSRVKTLLNHSSEAVTMLYAMADQVRKKGLTRKKASDKM